VNTAFAINTTGTGITYQWYKGNTALSNSAKYTGVTTATLGLIAVAAPDQGAYTCVVTTACGTKLTSSAAQLTIGTGGLITSKSSDLSLCSNEPARFSIVVSGGVLSYQWKKNNVALNDDTSISGSKSAELLLREATAGDAGNYTCEITPICGVKQASGIIKLAIKEQVEIIEQPGALQVCENEDFELSLNASGSIVSYQWKRNGVDLVNGGNVSGVKTNKLSVLNSSVGSEGIYTCEVTGCDGKVVTTGAAIAVGPKPDLQALPVVDCQDFNPEWSSLVIDQRNTSGSYHLFLQGTTDALDISEIKEHGIYIIVKQTEFCSDSVIWNNDCVITGVEDQTVEISITPNPTERWINFQYPPGALTKYSIYQPNGKVMRYGDLDPGGQTVIDGELWSSGIYMFMSHNKEGKPILKRFILQR
jgi:hypothetical protein